MQIPSGRVDPGMAFYQALQGLQRPQAGTETAAARAATAGQAGRGTAARAPDGARAAEAAGGPARAGEEAAAAGRDLPRGSLLDVTA